MNSDTNTARAALPVPTSMCRISVCPKNGMAAIVLGFWCAQILMHDCTWGLYRHYKRSALEVDLQKNPSLHQWHEPVSILHPAFQSDALPTELSPSHMLAALVAHNGKCQSYLACVAHNDKCQTMPALHTMTSVWSCPCCIVTSVLPCPCCT